MRPLFRIAAALAVASLLTVPIRVLAHSNTAKMPMIQVRILSPSPGAVIHANAVQVRVAISHWKLSCAWAGKANRAGTGHYHILLDGALVNMYCSKSVSVSMQNVKPGPHILTVLPAEDNHSDMMFMQNKEMRQITFTYRPSHPLPTLKAANLGRPSIAITSPRNGAVVGRTFSINIRVRDFHLSCALYGKPNLKGSGHWHINHDSMTGPMMGMGTMLGMSCAHSFQASTVGLKPGPHTFFAILEDNQHAPLMPDVFAAVKVDVK